MTAEKGPANMGGMYEKYSNGKNTSCQPKRGRMPSGMSPYFSAIGKKHAGRLSKRRLTTPAAKAKNWVTSKVAIAFRDVDMSLNGVGGGSFLWISSRQARIFGQLLSRSTVRTCPHSQRDHASCKVDEEQTNAHERLNLEFFIKQQLGCFD